MPDKLAVIQSEQTIKELSLIDDQIKGLVSSFNGLVDVSAKVSAGLIKGTPKEFLDAEKQMVAIQKQKAQAAEQAAKHIASKVVHDVIKVGDYVKAEIVTRPIPSHAVDDGELG